MNAIPWYKSPVFLSALVAFISGLVGILGKKDILPDDVITSAVQNFAEIVSVIAIAVAGIQRARAKAQPIKPSQASADAHNKGG